MGTQTLEPPVEDRVVTEQPTFGLDPIHLICHCSNDCISLCGMDVSHGEFMSDAPLEDDCPLCVLVYSGGACPWGCSCEECGEA